jgi:hypothetical protein
MKMTGAYKSEFYGSECDTVFLDNQENRLLFLEYYEVDAACNVWDHAKRAWVKAPQQYGIPRPRLYKWLLENVGSPNIAWDILRPRYLHESMPIIRNSSNAGDLREVGIQYHPEHCRKWTTSRSYGTDSVLKVTFFDPADARLFVDTWDVGIEEIFIPYDHGLAEGIFHNGKPTAEFLEHMFCLFGTKAEKPINLVLDGFRWTYYADTRNAPGYDKNNSPRGAVFCFRDRSDATLFKLKYYG